jgi:hypothetical protein
MRSSAADTRLALVASSRRKCERCLGGLGRTLAVFDLIGDYPQRQHFDPRNSIVPSNAIRHHAGQTRDRGEKAAISLALDFDLES